MDFDVVIIGSGVGGGAIALSLMPTGARILLIERGPRLPREAQNRDAEAVFVEQRYRTNETWFDGRGRPFRPGQYYFVGGHTKFYGCAMFRFRERDFEEVEHEEGISPAWPIRYADLEPYYGRAERLFGVRGQAGAEPTDPPRSTPYPHPPVPHEPVIADMFARLQALGLRPAPMPAAIDFGPGGRCERCGTCDAFPCRIDAKGDAEICLVDPALRQPNVTLWTESLVTRLITDDSGRRVVAAEVRRKESSGTQRVHGRLFVLAAGAINSAVLLQRSATPRHPNGLANSSGVVGRHYMNHNCTAFLTLDPLRVNETKFPKTLYVNDFYFGGSASSRPLGNLQLLGKIQEPMLRGPMRWAPRTLRAWTARHSVDWYVMSEDLPHTESTVRPRGADSIEMRWHRTNLRSHRRWVETARRLLKQAGLPIVLSRPFGEDTPSHQCGTVRFGTDPATSALDPLCKAWDHDNLYVVDAGFFPSSAALNPALTVAAQALRVGEHLRTAGLQ
ncbi:MAG TPA: GMC family oxidoreductase [Burkholderiaceae bacterium]|nr:GMC family oxidoreductase [Burkholderiaceae bacterium]